MKLECLPFEYQIEELKEKIEQLKSIGISTNAKMNIHKEIDRLENKCINITKKIFSNLSDWQIVQLARHPQRPYTTDYIKKIFTDFDELHGDRLYGDDCAIVAGTARIEGNPIMLIGQQKGRSTKEKIRRNFGMVSPEGYRKAQRMMILAEKFDLPIITFIDTAGAYPGIGAEERGQSEAIARSLALMSRLKVPIISLVIGEGGSGGALAIGVCDRLLMLQYSVYSVITPEGCASILWKDATKASLAAETMHLTAEKLYKLNLIDDIIQEPLGGAHRNLDQTAEVLKNSIIRELDRLNKLFMHPNPKQKIVDLRYERLMKLGRT